MPIVSIIMSAYKKDNPIHLKKAILSIITQTLTDIEVIIIGDGELSLEQLSVLEEYIKADERVKVYRNEQNMGLGYSMNRAISLSRGKYIARMDADDISLPERLEKQVLYLEEHQDCDLVGTFAYEIDENENIVFHKRLPVTSDDIYYFLAKRDPFIHPSVMFRRNFFDKVGNYNIKVPLGIEDTELWCRAFLLKRTKGANIPEFIYIFRAGSGFYNRRRGLGNGIQELKLRCNHIRQNKLSPHYYIYPVTMFIVRMLPRKVVKLIYNVAR